MPDDKGIPNRSGLGRGLGRGLALEHGGVARAVRGREARKRIDRELHGVVVQAGPVAGRVPEPLKHWWYDLRRKQNKPYGSLLQFLDTSVSLGVSKDTLLTIPAMLVHYIHDITDDEDSAA